MIETQQINLVMSYQYLRTWILIVDIAVKEQVLTGLGAYGGYRREVDEGRSKDSEYMVSTNSLLLTNSWLIISG